MDETPYDAQELGSSEAQYPEITNEAITWAVLCHLSAFAMIVLPTMGHVIGPLVVWLMKRHDHPFIDDHGKESVNFQISITIYTVLVLPLLCVVIGIPLLVAIWLANIVLIIMAAVRASNGGAFRYPLTIRLIS